LLGIAMFNVAVLLSLLLLRWPPIADIGR